MLSACIAYRSSARAFALLANSLCISSLAPVRSHAKPHPSRGRAYLPMYLPSNLIPTALHQSLQAGNPNCTSTDHTTSNQLFPFPSSPNKPRHQSYHNHYTHPCPQANTAFSRTKKEGPAIVHAHGNTDSRAARVPKGFRRPYSGTPANVAV